MTLKVYDDFGAFSTKNFTVNVVDTDIPKAKVYLSPIDGSTNVINFDASISSDSDGSLTYYWQFGDEPVADVDHFTVTTTPTISHTYANPGQYTANLYVKDANGGLGITHVYVFANTSPPLSAYPSVSSFVVLPARELPVGSTFNFDGSYSFVPTVGSSVESYSWNFDDNNACGDGCTASGVTTSHEYDAPGIWFPSLTTLGPDGFQFEPAGQEIYTVTAGHAPRAIARGDAFEGPAPFTVHFTSESYDYDGTIAETDWYFGDPACDNVNIPCNGQGTTVAHTFTQPGPYTIGMRIVDSDGNQAFSSVAVNVLDPSQAKAKRARATPVHASDFERDRQRQMFMNLCAKGRADGCYYLAKMYEEDGNTDFARKLKIKSCNMGYQPACQAKVKR